MTKNTAYQIAVKCVQQMTTKYSEWWFYIPRRSKIYRNYGFWPKNMYRLATLASSEKPCNIVMSSLRIWQSWFGRFLLTELNESLLIDHSGMLIVPRATRLGEFSPNGRLFTLGSGLKITEVARISGLLFFHGTSYVSISTKKCWATFWATFSQTHLVTLEPTSCCSFILFHSNPHKNYAN
jgi:hypothetical protein